MLPTLLLLLLVLLRTPCPATHVVVLKFLNHLHLLLKQVVEQNHLLLQLQTDVIGREEFRVLLFELLPHECGEARLYPGLVLQREDNVLLGHVLLQAPLYQVLNVLDVLTRNFAPPFLVLRTRTLLSALLVARVAPAVLRARREGAAILMSRQKLPLAAMAVGMVPLALPNGTAASRMVVLPSHLYTRARWFECFATTMKRPRVASSLLFVPRAHGGGSPSSKHRQAHARI
mmetsp:Transcript_3406/g.8464  ORF Transcript_3406/g.8464 Transcript_3406/m.8464 type:complete len:231 (-) Transcript_3406:297-989(-)